MATDTEGERILDEYDRLVLDSLHILLYAARASAPSPVVFRTVQDQMVACRDRMDRDDMRKQNANPKV